MPLPMCSGEHCSAVEESYNETCKEEGWAVNHKVMVCENGTCCNCTCSCLAYNTPVFISNTETMPIQSINIGDSVLARENGDWVEKTVEFSDGTSPLSVQPEMCYIAYIDQTEKIIVVTLDHTFLTKDNKLIRARQLSKGHKIQLADGSLTEIVNYELRSYTGGVWNIATSHEKPKSLDGHLLNTQGVISGDYAVQLYFNELAKDGYVVLDSEAPEFRSQKYQDMISDKNAQPSFKAAAPSVNVEHYLNSVSNPLHATKNGPGPGGVYYHLDHSFVLDISGQSGLQGYFTSAQAASIKANDTVVDKNIMTTTQWLLTLFSSFYPDINFIVDYPNPAANAFSAYLDNRPSILIQGGLLHAKKLQWEGTALIIAYSIARFRGKNNKGNDGLTCKPNADLKIAGILSSVFYPLYPTVIFPALEQIKALFDLIKPKEDGPVNGCHATTLECRFKTYEESIAYRPLPECAGGES